MTPNSPDSNSPAPNSGNPMPPIRRPLVDDNGHNDDFAGASSAREAAIVINYPTEPVRSTSPVSSRSPSLNARLSRAGIIMVATGLGVAGAIFNLTWLGLAGTLVALIVSARILWTPLRPIVAELVTDEETPVIIAVVGGVISLVSLLLLTGVGQQIEDLFVEANWDAIGALGDFFGAFGQILIAIVALYVAWRQYVISKDLTIQQNIITQQQTIDSYFQGVSELVLDEEGLLEDWPQERAIAEGRTAAILSSVDAGGKAKIIRFLSRARLLTPLKRDQRLGRAILDGAGGYAEDLLHGVRVIDLGVMLAGADLSDTDLRWTDLSEANLIRANLSNCDLVKANMARTILVETNLRGADFKGVRLFYGTSETATPRSRTEPPDYRTGTHTGAVVEGADFAGVVEMSPEQRYYCCAWGGEKTRSTIPGGCEGIPNQLGR